MNIRHLAVAFFRIERRISLEDGSVGVFDPERWEAHGEIRIAFWGLVKTLGIPKDVAEDIWFSAADEVGAATRIN